MILCYILDKTLKSKFGLANVKLWDSPFWQPGSIQPKVGLPGRLTGPAHLLAASGEVGAAPEFWSVARFRDKNQELVLFGIWSSQFLCFADEFGDNQKATELLHLTGPSS